MISNLFYKKYFDYYRIKSNVSERSLQRLLKYTAENIDYYRYLENDTLSISKFPVVNKEIYRKTGLDSFVTKENKNKGIVRRTSGSTGSPTKIYIDKFTLASQLFHRNKFFNLHDLSLGMSEARFWSRGKSIFYGTNNIKNILLNRKLINDLDFFGSESQCYKNLYTLFNVIYFYGYPSLILKAANFFENEKSRPCPKKIITTAEVLTSHDKNHIENVFNCPVIQEYGCSEVDIIAFQCKCNSYHLNPRLYIELEEVSGSGHEIIVTDLDNYYMPIIRYKMGDIVKLNDTQCSCGIPGRTISSICGRTSDRFIVLRDGSEIHVSAISSIINASNKYDSKISKFRIDHINLDLIDIKIEGNFNHENKLYLNKELISKLNHLLNDKITITITFSEIDNSIKHNYFKKLF